MSKADIGLIGLGVMGANLALNIAEKGFRVAVHNRTAARIGAFLGEAGALGENIIGCQTAEALVEAIERPRPIILMVQAGEAVDAQIEALKPLLDPEDIIIDAGNANFRDTQRRMRALDGHGPAFVGMGVSGGEEGARHGPSIMVGGPRAAYERIQPVLNAIAARYEGEACQAWLGPEGAGHFVKTIHNGIEYADMQMIAEIYGFLRDRHGLPAQEIAAIFARWNEGRLNSYLIEITAAVLSAEDPHGGQPLVDVIVDRAGQKGTGRWSAIEAQTLGIPATAIEAAVAARGLSSMKGEREAAEKLFPRENARQVGPVTPELLHTLEQALLAGKIVAYAQGFAVMAAASREYGWSLPLDTVARIWRAGCIIRSQFLGEIAQAFEAAPEVDNLLATPAFASLMREANGHLRQAVALGIGDGIGMPALGAALAHFDILRRGRGTANLIQAQRDYFGAHGFDRTDGLDIHHGDWRQV
ncbi:NADP-dependent phosphogluconate dehydrogenase [Nitratireductor thuwali]|uniref:6-phosphogluconate dehydrogenase, decarboxylating n=1 Tax=Nitratireductor thuwali TaxID=2267699 RepID=A0ABY5MI53_9HYPH|nr:6-phosphogluconate dehydrogenase, NADP(+)-dependent, decarboxylating [Nitratireductor thuwali]